MGGVGVFEGKNGVDLEFRNVIAKSSKIAVTEHVANNEIEIDVAEGNLSLANLGTRDIDDLEDVTITSAATDEVLAYNGTIWVNATAGSGGTKSFMGFSGAGTIVPKLATEYLGIFCGHQQSAEDDASYFVSSAGTVQKVYTWVGANGTANDSTIKIRKNNLSTGEITITYAGGAVDGKSELVTFFTVVAGDRVSIQVINGGGSGGGRTIQVDSVCFEIVA